MRHLLLLLVMVVAFAAAAVPACGGPDVQDGEVVCGTPPDPVCPPDFSCAADGHCYRHPPGGNAVCGDGTIEGTETCDPSSTCPSSCVSDGNDCTAETLRGSADTCNVSCSSTPIAACSGGDGCCPSGCTAASDSDCSATCGNGMVDPGETCDPISTCPASCDDGNACTADSRTGSEANCNVACTHDPVLICHSGDGCCPSGCTSVSDSDCSATCGNGVIEAGETCDPPTSCPITCDDANACTHDTQTGSVANCNVACGHTPIVSCAGGDGCCPGGCTSLSDSDCSSTCGNGVRDPGETCDPPSTCPTSCNDGIACTIDSLTGNAMNCNVACGHTTIFTCASGDGCCPSGCTSFSDSDCTPVMTCDGGPPPPPPGDGGLSSGCTP